MTIFKQSSEYGYAVTTERFKCKRCGQVDSMIKLKTSITPATDHIFSERLNPAPDTIQVEEEYLNSEEHYDFVNPEQPVLLGVEHRVEQIYYRWYFVECPNCKSKHILERSFYSEIGEETISLFALF